MTRINYAIAAAAVVAALAAVPVVAAPVAAFVVAAPATAPPSYADLADLTLAAPVIIRATIIGAERLSAAESPGLAPGNTRLLVTATIDAAIVAPAAVPARLTWLWDVVLDPRGKPPKPKGQTILAWLAAPGADGKTRLVAASGQRPWDAATEARVRAVASEARSNSVPVITGVANGFRADGTVAGESESQFFLTAADNRGVTLVVTSKPGEPRRVAVARGDVIDESASVVRRETLLWYRLACFLPARLPAGAGGSDVSLATDWIAALSSLGPCNRTP